MDREPVGVFVLTMRALAGPGNSQPDGRRCDLLVFARADSDADAEAVAANGLEALGWIERELVRCGEIVDAAAVPPDLQSAMANARRTGCAVIVYDEP